jgi:trehalose 6-phosphate phosphatase
MSRTSLLATRSASPSERTPERRDAPAFVNGAEGLPPGWPTRACALFLDFDGTLVDLAPTPDQVRTPSRLLALLAELESHLGGALAVVSGRPIADLDAQLQPLKLCAAGVHGAERRAGDGYLRRMTLAPLQDADALLTALCARFPALRLERKPGALALHYRLAPELEGVCVMAMQQAAQTSPGMSLMRGKMVVELKPARARKGAAVRSFLDTSPFRARRPWYFGDDVTDESAFEFVQSVGGVAVRIGPGETGAVYRLPDPAALHAWLEQAATRLADTGPAAGAPR